jgi:hypothetical protein
VKITDEEFKKLQKYWYTVLEQHGFKDIEKISNDNFVLVSNAKDCYRHNGDELLRKAKEDYYRLMTHAVESEHTVFKSEIDRYIMYRHSQGALIKEIVDELVGYGKKRDRKTVGNTIRRYEKLWGLRRYP